jgi:hypothetical protein
MQSAKHLKSSNSFATGAENVVLQSRYDSSTTGAENVVLQSRYNSSTTGAENVVLQSRYNSSTTGAENVVLQSRYKLSTTVSDNHKRSREVGNEFPATMNKTILPSSFKPFVDSGLLKMPCWNKENVPFGMIPMHMYSFNQDQCKRIKKTKAIALTPNKPDLFLEAVRQQHRSIFQSDLNQGNGDVSEQDYEQIAKLLSKACEELLLNKMQKRKHFSDVDWKKKKLLKNERRRFSDRMNVLKDLAQDLFKTAEGVTIEHVITYMVNYFDKVPDLVRSVHGTDLSKYVLTPADALSCHFTVGNSYAMFWRFAGALKDSTAKRVQYCSPEEVRAYRDSLDIGKIEWFRNHNGKTLGRAWSLEQSLKYLFSNPDIVHALNFKFGSKQGPHLVWSFHNDGAQQTAYSSFVAFLSRLISLDNISRIPASIIINGLDEAKESCILFSQFWDKFIIPGIKMIQDNNGKVPVLCLNFLKPNHPLFGNCQLCDNGHLQFSKEKMVLQKENFMKFHYFSFTAWTSRLLNYSSTSMMANAFGAEQRYE